MKVFKGIFSTKEERSEAGLYTPLFALVITSILIMMGLAVDGARLEIADLRTQRAADAGALSAGTYIGILKKKEIEQIARDVAQDNLKRMKMSFDPTAISAFYDETERKVTVNANALEFSELINKLLPNMNETRVQSPAAASRSGLDIILVLDKTGSMMGPKIAHLKKAAIDFLNKLSGISDRVGAVVFATDIATGTLFPLETLDDLKPLEDLINSISVGGRTSVQSGLLEGHAVIQNDQSNNVATRKIVILITDGLANEFEDSNPWDGCDLPPIPADYYKNCLFEHCAAAEVHSIFAADDLRDDNVTVYAIGIGSAASSSNAPFMRRLANDWQSAEVAHDSELYPGCLPPYADIREQPMGKYFGTADSAQLGTMFDEILKDIHVKLVE